MTAKERQKSLETYYAEQFLKLVGWNHKLEPREPPDFLMHTPGGPVGLELTQLFKDEGVDGSPQKKTEKKKARYLSDVATAYYGMGGKPLYVAANLSLWNLDRKLIPHIARRLIRRRLSELPGRTDFEVKTKHYLRSAEFFLQSLKDELGNYSWWVCLENSTGALRPAQDDVLSRKIEEKAEKLPEYRRVVGETVLLIVAERTQESGMFHYTAQPTMLPNHGFSEVHLLIHPMESWRIA